MNGAAGDSSHIGPPKLLLPITPRTLDGISPSSGVESFEAEESHEDRTNTQIFGDERLEEQNNLEDKSRRRVDSSESWESESVSSSSSSSDIEEGQVSMSFEAAHEFREIRATKIVQHYGRIRVFRGPLGAVFYIGPHWYAVIVMASVIVGIGFGFSFWATPRLNMSEGKRWWQRFIGVLLTIISLLAFLRCALLSDPGLLRVYPREVEDTESDEDEQWLPSTGRVYCRKCKVMQRKGTLHCEYCQVCIHEFDHHCPWIGKCIGAGNLADFYFFLSVNVSAFLYIAVVTGMYLGPI